MSSGQPEDADSTKREQRQRRMRRVQVAMAVFAACMGLIAFSSVAGNPRFVDDPSTNTGNGTPPYVDIGALERGP